MVNRRGVSRLGCLLPLLILAIVAYFAADAGRIGWIDAYPVWAAKEGFVLQGGQADDDVVPGLVVVTGAVAMYLPQLASKQTIDVGSLQLPTGPSEAETAAEAARRYSWESVAEGVPTTRSAHALAERERVEMPIVNAVRRLRARSGGDSFAFSRSSRR